MLPERTEAVTSNHFHAFLQKEALQSFRNISGPNRKTVEDALIVFGRKHVKPESQAKAKRKWHKLTLDPNAKSLSDFFEKLNECADRTFGDNAQHMLDSLLYDKIPPHLKRSIILAYLKNGTYGQIVAHLEKELELSDLDNDDELSIPTITTIPPNDSSQKLINLRLCANTVKKNGHFIRDCPKWIKKEQEQINDLSL